MKHSIRIVLISGIVVASCGVISAGQEPPLNSTCPVMTEEKADPAITVEYQGKRVAFCCDRCVQKFQANPERYLDRLPQFAASFSGTPSEARAAATPAAAPAPLLGRLHPVLVHFPVAGLPLALAAALLYLATRQEAFARADVPPLVAAGLFAVAAYFSGDAAEEASQFSSAMHEIAERHELISTIVMGLSLGLVGLRLWRWRSLAGAWQALYLVGLLAATGLVAYTGYLGGSLVFGPDHLRL